MLCYRLKALLTLYLTCNCNTILLPSSLCPYKLILITSKSTLYCHNKGNCINIIRFITIVACKYCAKSSLPCKLALLSKKCRNCKYNRIKKCEPVDLLILDFLKINNKMLRLEEIEDKAAKAEEAVMAAL